MSEPLWLHNLAAYSAQIGLLVVTGALLSGLFRPSIPRVMLAHWQTLLAVCLVLPLVETRKPVPLPQATTLVSIPLAHPAAATRSGFPSPATAGSGPAFGPRHSAPNDMSFRTRRGISEILALLLGLGIVARLGWLALGLARLRRYRCRADRLFPLPAAVRDVAAQLGLNPAFYVSDEADSPITFGKLHPAVLFPRGFLAMDAHAQRAIACHELLHIERHDWAWNLVEEFILALFWFHPAVWWLVGRIRLTREMVVDSEVLLLTRERKSYLNALLEIASGKLAPSAAPAPFFLRERQLAERVALMLKEVSMSKSRLAVSLTAVCGLLLLSAGVAVWSFPLQAPARQSVSSVASDVAGGVRGGIDSGVPGGIPGGIIGGIQGGVGRTDQSQALRLVRSVPPAYPPLAKQAGLGGDVKLRLHINTAGEVDNIEVLSGHPLLVKAAIDAVRQWRYAEDSALLPPTTDVTLTFSPDDKEKKPEPAQDKEAATPNSSQEAATIELLSKQIEELHSRLPDPKELEALRKALAQARASLPNPEQLEAARKALAEAQSNMIEAHRLRTYDQALKEADYKSLQRYQTALGEIEAALKEYQAAAEKSAQGASKDYQNALKEYEKAARKSAQENEKALRQYQAAAEKSALEQKEYQDALKEYEAAARRSAQENDKALKEYQETARKLAEGTSQRAGQATAALKVAHLVRPVYPPSAKKGHIEGNVTLDVAVDQQGNVTDIRVIDGREPLVKAALDAVKEWKYEPPKQAPVHTTVTVNFTLDAPAENTGPGAKQPAGSAPPR
jgi:TonB family protein